MPRTIGIIPAAGKGTRLAPYPGPKELFPIGWQPYAVNGETHRRPKVISQYVIENMVGAGVREIVIIVGEHKYDLLRYYANGERFGAAFSYVFQEEALGMMHAIDLCRPWVGEARIVFGMPDTIVHPPDAFARLMDAHVSNGADLTLGLFPTARPHKFGMIGLDDRGRVVQHVDKPKSTSLRLMWGFAAWEPSFTELIHEVSAGHRRHPSGREMVLGDAFDEAMARGLHVRGVPFPDGFYLDIGTYDEIVDAQGRIAEVLK
jgi:glucose-1-phosphate thymidylyltransferase